MALLLHTHIHTQTHTRWHLWYDMGMFAFIYDMGMFVFIQGYARGRPTHVYHTHAHLLRKNGIPNGLKLNLHAHWSRVWVRACCRHTATFLFSRSVDSWIWNSYSSHFRGLSLCLLQTYRNMSSLQQMLQAQQRRQVCIYVMRACMHACTWF